MAEQFIPGARISIRPSEREDMLNLLKDVLDSNKFLFGPMVSELEQAVAAYTSRDSVTGVSSGTSALEIILRTIDIVGKEVIVPANTFYATAGAVVHAGGCPVFADVGSDLMLTTESVDAVRTARTVAVIAVHIGGMISSSFESLAKYSTENGLNLVEDAAHAIGSRIGLDHVGSRSVAAAISLYPTKIVTAGEGGLILTDSSKVREEAILLRDQGKVPHSDNVHTRAGYSWRLSEFHAAVGRIHLKSLEDTIARKRQIARIYDKELLGSCVSIISEPAGHRWNRHRYIVLADTASRAETIVGQLKVRGIGVATKTFALPLHRQPIFAEYSDGVKLPIADDVCARHICLPIHGDMSDSEIARVVSAMHSIN